MYKKGDDIIYSHEIERLLKIKHNILTTSEYLEILSTSPQINHIKYEDNYFKIETDDKYKFKVFVKSRTKS